MKHIGQGKIITDTFMDHEKGEIVDVWEYETGDEVISSGELYEQGEGEPDYCINYGGDNLDCYEYEIELDEGT